MGGGKGGSDFNPKGKSDREVMRFCQSFMTELSRHIGPDTDVPAGDIGVGAREISYMFGQYKRLKNEFTGVLTGKALSFGGSLIRTEATGFGAVYFLQDMLAVKNEGLAGKVALVSGSGNVAQNAIGKLVEEGSKVLTASDSGGFVHVADGFDEEKVEYLKELKNVKRGRLSEFAEHFGCDYHEGQRPWSVPCDMALPCATQNEIDADDAATLIKNGCTAISEGANMPTVQDGVDIFHDAKIMYAPSKAANAGGVAVSGLEMTQNSMRISWDREELDGRLRKIMHNIHEKCVQYGDDGGPTVDYVKGANIAGFVKVADAMIAYGTN
jgi:glutamate dehydrogenase/leucine dehydrogenase